MCIDCISIHNYDFVLFYGEYCKILINSVVYCFFTISILYIYSNSLTGNITNIS